MTDEGGKVTRNTKSVKPFSSIVSLLKLNAKPDDLNKALSGMKI
jgi:hypothetical protein